MIGRSAQNPPPEELGNGVPPGIGEDDEPSDDVGSGVGVGVAEPPQATRMSDTSNPTATVLTGIGA